MQLNKHTSICHFSNLETSKWDCALRKVTYHTITKVYKHMPFWPYSAYFDKSLKTQTFGVCWGSLSLKLVPQRNVKN